ncbi:hypothetical protein BXQ17_06225 [Polaribacter sp. BM10]|nr:hypothetical protein BXQ17_06225 [Polaribacter sp. BM10]
MNVIFHIATGVTIFSVVSKREIMENQISLPLYFFSFVLGVISHGILDYIPHCYPLNSKVDVILGLFLMLFLIYAVKMHSKLLILVVLFGCIFPDIIDLSPGILNSIFNINLPIFDNIFPWHFHEYSGSIYIDECSVSNINHLLTLIFCTIIIYLNRMNILKNFKTK